MGLKILFGKAQFGIESTCYYIGLGIYVCLQTLPLGVGGGVGNDKWQDNEQDQGGDRHHDCSVLGLAQD
jgi:hypothetical protein